MAKPKQRPLVATLPNTNSIPVDLETQLPEEDSWVIVKKLRVRILVPPLPANKQSTSPNLEPTQSQARLTKLASQSPSLNETGLKMHSVDQVEQSLSLAPTIDIPTARRSPRPSTTIQKLPKKYDGIHFDNFRSQDALGVHSRSKSTKRPFSFLGASVLLNQRMRALILDRKLQRAGGLSSWLASMGLARFATMFRGKNAGKFQLVNLSMKKLKDMGANAVGPRRKLMHAIDCLCEPSCFGAL